MPLDLDQMKYNMKMEDPKFHVLIGDYDLPILLAMQVKELRLKSGLTQMQVAKLMHTKQAGIARLERGKSLPSLSFMQKLADALKQDINITIKPRR